MDMPEIVLRNEGKPMSNSIEVLKLRTYMLNCQRDCLV